MGRKKKEKLVEGKPIGNEHRADRIRYWLEQRDYASNFHSPEWKSKTIVFDRMILGMIEKATEGNASCANWVMENAFGKNTEGADTSGDVDTGITLDWNAPSFKGEEDE